MKISIFTDGSARGNPGPGGWGAIVLSGEKVTELGGTDPHTTNNKMELLAAIKALEYISKDPKDTGDVTLYSDSQYVVKGMTEWLSGWQKNNWRTAARKPVLNQELWMALASVSAKFKINWRYVAGHAGHDANERCDVIATSFADTMPVALFSGDRKDYPVKIDEK